MQVKSSGISVENVGSILQSARKLKQRNEYRKALDLLAPLMETHGGKAELQHLAGELYESLHEFNAAHACFDKAHTIRLKWIAPMMGLGRVARLQGEPLVALDWFKQVAAQEPGHLGALRQSAGVLLEQKHFDEAEVLLSGGLNANPNDLEMARLIVKLMIETGRFPRAETLARRILLRHPKDSAIWLLLFRALRKQKKQDELLAATAEAASLLPDMPSILGERVEQLRLHGDYEIAKDSARSLRNHLRSALGQLPAWGQLQLDLGRFDQIASFLTETFPAGEDTLGVHALLLRARAAHLQGYFGAAVSDLRQILCINAGHVEAGDLLGSCLFALFDLEAIQSHLKGRSVQMWLHQLMLNDMRLYPEENSALHAVASTLSGKERIMATACAVAESPHNSAIAYYWLQQLAHTPDIFCPDEGALANLKDSVIQYWNGTPGEEVAATMSTWNKPRWISAHRLFDSQMAYDRLKAYYAGMTRDEFDAFLPATQADLLRLLLLYEDGGIWSNADCLVRRVPPQGFFSRADLVLVLDEQGMISNSVMAASSGHPVIKAALESALFAAMSQPQMWHALTSGKLAISMACAQQLGREMIMHGCIRSTFLYKMHEVRPYLSLDLKHDYHKTRHIPPSILKRLSRTILAPENKTT